VAELNNDKVLLVTHLTQPVNSHYNEWSMIKTVKNILIKETAEKFFKIAIIVTTWSEIIPKIHDKSRRKKAATLIPHS
jgi:hypothetical protein